MQNPAFAREIQTARDSNGLRGLDILYLPRIGTLSWIRTHTYSSIIYFLTALKRWRCLFLWDTCETGNLSDWFQPETSALGFPPQRWSRLIRSG